MQKTNLVLPYRQRIIQTNKYAINIIKDEGTYFPSEQKKCNMV